MKAFLITTLALIGVFLFQDREVGQSFVDWILANPEFSIGIFTALVEFGIRAFPNVRNFSIFRILERLFDLFVTNRAENGVFSYEEKDQIQSTGRWVQTSSFIYQSIPFLFLLIGVGALLYLDVFTLINTFALFAIAILAKMVVFK